MPSFSNDSGAPAVGRENVDGAHSWPIARRSQRLPSLPLSSLQISGVQGDKQSWINGEYYETFAPGRPPLYRQEGGDYWLYFSDATSQWHIGNGEDAMGRGSGLGFIYSRPAVPGACPSEARGWTGHKTHQPSLIVAPIALAKLEDFLSDEVAEPGAFARKSTSSSSSPMRRAKSWRDTADRGWGNDSYKFGDLTRGVVQKFNERRRSTRRGQDVAIMEMETVTELAEAHKNTMELERALFGEPTDSQEASSFWAVK